MIHSNKTTPIMSLTKVFSHHLSGQDGEHLVSLIIKNNNFTYSIDYNSEMISLLRELLETGTTTIYNCNGSHYLKLIANKLQISFYSVYPSIAQLTMYTDFSAENRAELQAALEVDYSYDFNCTVYSIDRTTVSVYGKEYPISMSGVVNLPSNVIDSLAPSEKIQLDYICGK